MADSPDEGLQAAIAALWRDARPRVLGRVATLAVAADALAAGELTEATAAEAAREAHKLVGALGTFGMPDGSRLARAIERRLEDGADREDAATLREAVAALRAMVEAGPSGA